MTAHQVPILDYTAIPNALSGGGPPPTPGTVSFQVVWSGVKERVQLKNTDPVWISDLISRRWVQSTRELTAVQKSLKKAGVPTTVTVVTTLAPYGVPVGPLPE